MDFLYCILFLLASGILVFFIGRALPRKWILENKFPYRSFKFERNGSIYEKINIRKWKDKLPDASVIISKIIPNFMKKKRVENGSASEFQILVKESCIAEMTHFFAAMIGFACLAIWKGLGGAIISVLYFLWNMIFIVMQRYNRPRYLKMIEMLEARNIREKKEEKE